jgi:periplasmic protein TonB
MNRALKQASVVLALWLMSSAAWAQGELLRQVRDSHRSAATFNEAREQRFQAERDAQARQLREAGAEAKRAEARIASARKRWEAARADTAAAERRLKEARRDLETLFDGARGAAVDLHDIALRSPVTLQFPDRIETLAPLAAVAETPGREELEALWQALLLEMRETGQTARFEAVVAGTDGETVVTVTRIGAFTVFDGSNYFTLAPGATRAYALPRPASGAYRRTGAAFARAGDGYAVAVIDPTRGGSLLLADALRPGLFDRLWSSGIGGYFIAGILAFAVLLALTQLAWLRSRVLLDEQSISIVAATLAAFAVLQWWMWTPRGDAGGKEIVAYVDLTTEQDESDPDEPPPPELTPPPPPPEVQVSSVATGLAGLPALAAPNIAPLLSNITVPAQLTGGGSLMGKGFGGFARGLGTGAGSEGFGRGQGFRGAPLIPLSTARPQMPDWACQQRIKGWVEAVFTVMPNGRVQDVKIIDADPRGVYEIAAIESISNWIYAEHPRARTVKQRVPMDPADCAFNWR